MINKKFIFLIHLLFYCNTIFSITMKKDEVLKINILKYKSEKECPNYSNGYDNNNKHCTFRFFCRNNECSSADEQGYILLPNSNGLLEPLNTNTCFPVFDSKPICYDNKANCTKNEECFTNNCINSVCLVKKDTRTTECIDYYYYRSWLYSYKAKMHCGLSQNELCNNDKECASRLCESNTNNNLKMCSEKIRNDLSNKRKNDILKKIIIIVICVIISSIISCIVNKRKVKKEKEKEEEEEEEWE
ncbi:hypothetical protein BCR32DRAFT_55615 [Anaeromyces robustus]|uniref:Dickkopf N-terminal cysteine-rich domain-containing protein n=1 Tax=Anaeromyces robustus TaxID=1754192 RepID=A0A1Y1WXI2_9FUNG|nr:hypothetical protein BCR32DRAFT_55615 [Anaeromyces robustus]|eukprot:ORX77916.1 hypothetical protein BCR32DRAFT_55615 [Anaeromyces robustus]